MTRKLRYRRYEELKELGADLIEDYTLTYPLDPFYLADLLGLHVTVHQHGLPPKARPCTTEDGYTVPVEGPCGARFHVHLNGGTSPLRQRFTLMHEIAHVWLHHPSGEGPANEDVAESEANFLAAYLLAPDVLVVTWVPGLTVAGIAREFLVSDEAAALIHRRVMGMLNTNSQGRDYDRRIASAAVKRVPNIHVGSAQEWQGSA